MAPVMSKPVALFSRDELLLELSNYPIQILCAFVTLYHEASTDQLRREAASFLFGESESLCPVRDAFIHG